MQPLMAQIAAGGATYGSLSQQQMMSTAQPLHADTATPLVATLSTLDQQIHVPTKESVLQQKFVTLMAMSMKDEDESQMELESQQQINESMTQ